MGLDLMVNRTKLILKLFEGLELKKESKWTLNQKVLEKNILISIY